MEKNSGQENLNKIVLHWEIRMNCTPKVEFSDWIALGNYLKMPNIARFTLSDEHIDMINKGIYHQ